MALLCLACSSPVQPSPRCTADLTHNGFGQTPNALILKAQRTRSGLIDAQDCLAQPCFATAALSSIAKGCTCLLRIP